MGARVEEAFISLCSIGGGGVASSIPPDALTVRHVIHLAGKIKNAVSDRIVPIHQRKKGVLFCCARSTLIHGAFQKLTLSIPQQKGTEMMMPVHSGRAA